jgi:hypothetical protein
MSRNPFQSNTARIARRLTLLAGALAGVSAVALPAASAQAAATTTTVTAPTTTACEAGATTEAFLPWGDTNQYGLLAGGNFEGSLTGWTLTGGAKTVAGSEPFKATGTLGAFSMSLPAAGASVTTPLTCVDAGTPTFRFFAHNLTSSAEILVQVVYTPPSSTSAVVVSVGVVSGDTAWAPTKAMVTGGTILSAKTGSAAEVSLRFTAVGGASQFDDIFVDPRHAK